MSSGQKPLSSHKSSNTLIFFNGCVWVGSKAAGDSTTRAGAWRLMSLAWSLGTSWRRRGARNQSCASGCRRSVAVEMVAINIKWTLDLGDIS